jgi:signal transduction histidine kinase/ActR/RegA family two-component response regulator
MNPISKDGSILEFDVTISPIRDSSGKITSFVSIARNVTKVIEMEERLRRAETMEALGTLAGGVAHDLNNVLGAIVGYPDLLLKDIPEDSPMRRSIMAIRRSGERASAIVQDLLTLARRGVQVTEVVNLNTVLTKCLESVEYKKLEELHPDVELETNLEKDLLNILGSPVHLSKTAINLLSNAVEAMPGGGKITISSENRYLDKPIKGYDSIKEGDYVILSVKDNGIGIANEDLDKIFEPFYTKKVMGRSGTGLGMAVVWGTLKDHRGYIDVKSIEGQGTTFTLYFPVTRKEIEDIKEPVSIEEYSGNGEKILVVDDAEAQRDVATNLLQELNYTVETVVSGEEALEYMKSNTADLLLLDMIMDPGIDGLDTYKGIIEMHPGQKAIIASGFSETDRVRETQKLGAGAYIRKPYTLEKIGLAVKTELGRKT